MQKKIREFAVKRTLEQVDFSRKEIVFFEEGNPRCVLNLMPEIPREAARVLPASILSLSLPELRKRVQPTDNEEQLRLAFWDEYFLSSDSLRMMRMDSVYGRVCSREFFYKYIVRDPLKLAYILRPPEDYLLKVRGLLELGLERFAEILRLPIVPPNGKIDPRLIGQIVHIVTLLDNRVRGAVPQKLFVEGKHLNLNATYEAPKSYEDISREIRAVEKEIAEIQGTSAQVIQELFPEVQGVGDASGDGGTEEVISIEAEATRIS